MNFDIKNEEPFYYPDGTIKVWRNVRYAIRKGVHVEVVKLVVTGIDGPQCNELLIHRHNHTILHNKITDGKCPQCRKTIYGIWN